MSKWEYCTVIQHVSPNGEPITPVTVSKLKGETKYEESTLEKAIVNLGDDGWEMVGGKASPVAGFPEKGYTKSFDMYWFKRQVTS